MVRSCLLTPPPPSATSTLQPGNDRPAQQHSTAVDEPLPPLDASCARAARAHRVPACPRGTVLESSLGPAQGHTLAYQCHASTAATTRVSLQGNELTPQPTHPCSARSSRHPRRTAPCPTPRHADTGVARLPPRRAVRRGVHDAPRGARRECRRAAPAGEGSRHRHPLAGPATSARGTHRPSLRSTLRPPPSTLRFPRPQALALLPAHSAVPPCLSPTTEGRCDNNTLLRHRMALRAAAAHRRHTHGVGRGVGSTGHGCNPAALAVHRPGHPDPGTPQPQLRRATTSPPPTALLRCARQRVRGVVVVFL